MIRVSAFQSVPPFAQGLVRDLRVRWALEEAGLPYEQQCCSATARRTAPPIATGSRSARSRPMRKTACSLFESGAIVLHIAERSRDPPPGRPGSRARARSNGCSRPSTRSSRRSRSLAAIDLFYAERGLGEAAPPRRRGSGAETPRRPRRRARRQALARRRPLHRRRPVDGDGAANPPPHRCWSRRPGSTTISPAAKRARPSSARWRRRWRRLKGHRRSFVKIRPGSIFIPDAGTNPMWICWDHIWNSSPFIFVSFVIYSDSRRSRGRQQ